MWAGVQGKNYTAEGLKAVIEAGGVPNTILGSDLGQEGNPTPVEGLRFVIQMLIDLDYNDDDIRLMIGGNAAKLLSLDAADVSTPAMKQARTA